MSKLFSFLVLPIAFVSLFVGPVLAQDAAPVGVILHPITGRVVPPDPTPDLAIVVSAGAEMGLLGDGDEDGRRNFDGLQAFGSVHLFVGHDVYADRDLTIALGYEGSLGFGRWNLMAREPQDVLVTRQGVGVGGRMGIVGCMISGGLAYALEPATGISTVGGSILAQLAFFAGPVWIGVPVGVDIWPDQHVYSQIFGLTVGGHTM
ncbi:MAG: hypothetical protein J0L92_32495 [Deltaproteobacteria bacterium]|nr:hypothetical protein [Deltaproteobacteria bacterium]